MANQKLTIPNLIQGVSQQAPQLRRLTQCQAQKNCLNTTIEGVIARGGAELVSVVLSGDMEDAHWSFFERGEESYLVGIKGGDIKVWNLDTGAAASVTAIGAASLSYVSSPSPYRDISSVQAEDTLFVANGAVSPAMDAGVSPSRPYEAMFHLRSGNYLTSYRVSILIGSTNLVYEYKTPDNSVAANAQYITTQHIAATLYRAMTSGAVDHFQYPGGGTTYPGSGYQPPSIQLGQKFQTGGVVSPGANINTNGFGIQINGNVVHLWHNFSNFSIDVDDGAGGSSIIAFQDTVQAFSKLPSAGIDGYVVKVLGDKKAAQDDYYVKFEGGTGSSGSWVETLKPGTPNTLSDATMPHTLVNVGLNQFEWRLAPWGQRLVGDETSDPDPSFIGAEIKDLIFNNSRLGIITEAAVTWSRLKNPYVFFKSTVQTELENDPIETDVQGAKLSILEQGVHAKGLVSVWSRKEQFAVKTGDNGFALKNLNVRSMSDFNFAINSRPLALGTSLYFASEENLEDTSGFATLTDLKFQGEQLLGSAALTDHVPKYIPEGVRQIAGDEVRKTLAVRSAGRPTSLFIYNWFIGPDDQRDQSAWNEWTFEACGDVLWVGFSGSVMRIAIQVSPTRLAICKLIISPLYVDPGHDYHTRLDLRCSEAQVTGLAYNSGADTTTFTLPYVPLAAPVTVCRESVANSYMRGRIFEHVSLAGAVVTVKGNLTGVPFFVGIPISSEREFSTPYVFDQEGAVALERLQLMRLRVDHADTGYYRMKRIAEDGTVSEEEVSVRELGSPRNVFGPVPLGTGFKSFPVQFENTRVRCILINDSVLPSRWQFATWTYKPTEREQP